MKYLIITEDGSLYKANEITDSERNAIQSGILEVVDTENMEYLTANVDVDEWESVEDWVK